ncbi:xanthine dehydrogenase small subunit [Nitratireductor aestuarii]|uniref:Xanthine dehydrogenase small subunit n=1 Tax=Nitratireductor aestuarii TaxID=1735103 RepID=A0A916RQ75_9HYPH|nr:xanthine dehydrogenase small subunit [Nitratireductor aestuarii]GGA64700.1 xanthine dehydrogenase small subunit [Nitratireductor aestuarii]
MTEPSALTIRTELRFLLNDRQIALNSIRPDQTLLDFIRLDRRLTGTKEGCAEGDCGACTVLVGRLEGDTVKYETVNSCIRFLGSLDGCHVVTIEHLKRPDGSLHPVQQAMVDFHGSQCGFCTPGFVMALYGLWMQRPQPSVQAIETAIQGNLCRCTGYEPIIKAAQAISSYGTPENDPLAQERAKVVAELKAIKDGRRVEVGSGEERFIIPASADDLAAVLETEPSANVVAGSTDVGLWVTKFMRKITPVVFIGGIDELRGITVDERGITLGALVSYSDAQAVLAEHVPAFGKLIHRIGGEQVRNMGTIGGNVANGSPIGDTPPPLIALNASVTLRKGAARRTIPLEQFFIAYGKQDRQPGEFVEAIHIPLPEQGTQFAAWKISKRREEDITSVLGAFLLKLAADGTVETIRIAYGGMAATPKRAAAVEAALTGKPWNAETIETALHFYEADFKPISDMRASSAYRMLSARNLLRRFHLATTKPAGSLTVSRYEAA